MGLTTFAFGLGGPIGTFAALLHMTVHSLTPSPLSSSRSATPAASAWTASASSTGARPWVGMMLGTLGILGLPPFGVFTSEFLIITTTMYEQLWATPVLLVSLAVAFGGDFGKVQPMVFGSTDAPALLHSPALVSVNTHMALVLLLGLYIPPFLVQ